MSAAQRDENVPPGSKRTEVGILPQDWDVLPISALSVTGSGTTPPRAMESRYFHNGSVHWLKTLDLNNGVVRTSEERITRAAVVERGLRLYPRGTVVIAMYGGFAQIGRTGLLSIESTINQALTAITPNTSRLDPRFLLEVLNYHIGYWRLIASSSRRDPNITGRDVREFRLPVPAVAEQCAIAKALSDVDGLLGTLEALIAKKRAIKQAAMQQLLTGKTRLPGFSGEWETKEIGDFADCTAGGTPSTSVAAFWGGAIRWMNSGELNHKQVTEVSGRITSAGLANSSARLLPERCVLIGLAGQGKTRGTVAMNLVTLCTNQSIAAVLPNSGFVPEYVYFNLDARYDELRELSSGDGGRGGLNLKLIKGLRMPFPTVQEQTAIAAVLSDMDAEIAALEARRDKTRAIKQGMMQQLLTGRVRLVKPEPAPTAA